MEKRFPWLEGYPLPRAIFYQCNNILSQFLITLRLKETSKQKFSNKEKHQRSNKNLKISKNGLDWQSLRQITNEKLETELANFFQDALSVT